MELDEFKSAWKTLEFPVKDDGEVLSMIRESKHPVLKKIRRQLTIELAGLTVFLLCYWSLFDGASRHLWVNLLLVVTILITICYNAYGYYVAKNIVDNANLQASLKSYLNRMKRYALGSVISKALYAFSLITFFTYDLKFNSSHYYALGGVMIIFIIQLIFLAAMWAGRLSNLRKSIVELS